MISLILDEGHARSDRSIEGVCVRCRLSLRQEFARLDLFRNSHLIAWEFVATVATGDEAHLSARLARKSET